MEDQSLSSILRTLNFANMTKPEMSIVDIIDILIVAYIVYKIITWVKETRAWTLFKGIVVIFLLYAVATMLQLNTIHWLLSKTISVGIIAFVILFQPEMRKALEQLGNGRMIKGLFKFESQDMDSKFEEQIIEEVVTAAEKMGSVKTGALILIERLVPLGDHIRTGIQIDGIVTSQLLINIFEHNTPLHDGAVIIQGNRVVSATCYLPLSDNLGLSKELGTRHRAGVGISEITDSLTIIVSEETGKISVAYEGELERNLDADSLRDRMHKILNNPVEEHKNLRIWKGRSRDKK